MVNFGAKDLYKVTWGYLEKKKATSSYLKDIGV